LWLRKIIETERLVGVVTTRLVVLLELMASQSISRIAMMMSYHYNPITLKAFLEQNMVWKLLEIAPSPAARVIMMSFWVALDIIDCIINLIPELVTQVIRDIRILCRYVPGILRRPWVDDQWLHRANYLPQSFLNSSLETPTTLPESNSADRFSTSSSSTQ
jgi:hypothetical protein